MHDTLVFCVSPPKCALGCLAPVRMDCTLKELSSLIREVNPDLREKGTVLSFATVYADRRGLHKVKEIGTTVCGRKGNDDLKTLRSQKFQIGDFMSVAVSRRASRGRPY